MYGRNGVNQENEIVTSTRIDMLLAIYDAAIDSIDAVLERISADQPNNVERAHAIVLIGLIESGLDLEKGEVPNRISELCHFAERSLLTEDVDAIRSSRTVLCNLRDGFQAIREQGVSLEQSGEIPSLQMTNAIDTLI